MKNLLKFALIPGLLLVMSGALTAQDLNGTWTMNTANGPFTLVIQVDAQGQLRGTLQGSTGVRMQLEGMLQDGIGVGVCSDGQSGVYFEAHPQGNQLIFIMIEPDANRQPNYDRTRQLTFTRQGGSGGYPPPGGSNQPRTYPQPQTQPVNPGGQNHPSYPPPGQQAPSGGSRVDVPELGISFTPPPGWTAQKQQGFCILVSGTQRGFILILPHQFSNLQQMATEAGGGFVDEASGIRLMPTAPFQSFGSNGIAGEFSGVIKGEQARAFVIGLLSPQGGGVTILGATKAAEYTPEHARLVQTIAGGISFTARSAGGTGGGTPSAAGSDPNLMRWIAGRYYSYSSGSTMYGSAGTERRVMLCPDGRFYDSSEFSASGRGGGTTWGGANANSGVAHYRIQGNRTRGIITIIRPDGRTEQVEYQVTGETNVIMFGGIKFAFEGTADCN